MSKNPISTRFLTAVASLVLVVGCGQKTQAVSSQAGQTEVQAQARKTETAERERQITGKKAGGEAKSQTAAVKPNAVDDAGARKAFKQISDNMKKKDYESASLLMTKSGFEEFVTSRFIEAVMMTQEFEGMPGKKSDVVTKYKLDSLPLDELMGPEEDEEASRKIQKLVLGKFKDKNDMLAALTQLDKEKKAEPDDQDMMMIELDFFAGKVLETIKAKEGVVLKVKPSIPGVPAGGMVMGGIPDFFLKFKKVGDTWKWDGVDEERMAPMGEGFGASNRPTIEDPDFEGTAFSGKKVKLKDYRGKLVLVDFWGTWCKPCVAELPKLQKIYEALKPHGFEIIGIAADDKKALAKFFEKKPLPWPNVVDGEKDELNLCDRFNVNAFPTTLLIDQKGNHVASDLHSVELFDELVERLDLKREDFADLRKELQHTQPRGSGPDKLSEQLKKLGYQSIELTQMASGHLVASAVVNKKHRLRLVVDTGAGATLVTPEIAKRLQLNSKDSGGTAGGLGGGGMAVGEGQLDHFQLGSFAADNMPIAVIDIRHVNDQFKAIGEKPVEGIIGSDWLTEQGALIDVEGLRLFVKTGEGGVASKGDDSESGGHADDQGESDGQGHGDDAAELRMPRRGQFGQRGGQVPQRMAVGFAVADADSDKKISSKEMRSYLAERLVGMDVPFDKVFERLDEDNDTYLVESEFAKRHAAIEHFVGPAFGMGSMPADPGKDYVFFQDPAQPVDDLSIMGALMHRSMEMTPSDSHTNLDKVPTAIAASVPQANSEPKRVKRLAKATAIITGNGEGFFTGGAVVISGDGLAVTNYHIAELLGRGDLVAFTTDGKPHRVVEMLAGDKERDVALIRLEGEDFAHVPIAKDTPKMGDGIVMLHHTENRFYTYDRGYVMRHPMVGAHPWMEISADYAPGGSGCGIYNEKHELVGLVSMIKFGDGPSLGEDAPEDEAGAGGPPHGEDGEESYEDGPMGPGEQGMIMVKHAVPLSAIRGLWKSK